MTKTQTTVATSPAHLMKLFAAKAAAGDVEALLELYEPNAVFQPEFGVALVGLDQIRPASVEFLAMKPQITYTSEPDVVITGDIALVSNSWTMEATAPDGTILREGGISADVVRRQADGSWLVLIDQPRGEPVAA
jgi:uncharacterized protein (TIGR02246 family)